MSGWRQAYQRKNGRQALQSREGTWKADNSLKGWLQEAGISEKGWKAGKREQGRKGNFKGRKLTQRSDCWRQAYHRKGERQALQNREGTWKAKNSLKGVAEGGRHIREGWKADITEQGRNLEGENSHKGVAACEGVGESQFGRLEKKHSTLSTLCTNAYNTFYTLLSVKVLTILLSQFYNTVVDARWG
jgi:hypothetical protein